MEMSIAMTASNIPKIPPFFKECHNQYPATISNGPNMTAPNPRNNNIPVVNPDIGIDDANPAAKISNKPPTNSSAPIMKNNIAATVIVTERFLPSCTSDAYVTGCSSIFSAHSLQ